VHTGLQVFISEAVMICSTPYLPFLEPYLPFSTQLKLVLIYRPRRDGWLSWPGWLVTQGSHAPGKSWKVLDFFGYNFQVLESPGKWVWSSKVLEI